MRLLKFASNPSRDFNESQLPLNGSDFESGLKVINSLGCENVYVYAMGAEPWMQFVTSIDPSEESIPAVNAKQLVAHCLSIGIKAERLFGSHDVYTD